VSFPPHIVCIRLGGAFASELRLGDRLSNRPVDRANPAVANELPQAVSLTADGGRVAPRVYVPFIAPFKPAFKLGCSDAPQQPVNGVGAFN